MNAGGIENDDDSNFPFFFSFFFFFFFFFFFCIFKSYSCSFFFFFYLSIGVASIDILSTFGLEEFVTGAEDGRLPVVSALGPLVERMAAMELIAADVVAQVVALLARSAAASESLRAEMAASRPFLALVDRLLRAADSDDLRDTALALLLGMLAALPVSSLEMVKPIGRLIGRMVDGHGPEIRRLVAEVKSNWLPLLQPDRTAVASAAPVPAAGDPLPPMLVRARLPSLSAPAPLNFDAKSLREHQVEGYAFRHGHGHLAQALASPASSLLADSPSATGSAASAAAPAVLGDALLDESPAAVYRRNFRKRYEYTDVDPDATATPVQMDPPPADAAPPRKPRRSTARRVLWRDEVAGGAQSVFDRQLVPSLTQYRDQYGMTSDLGQWESFKESVLGLKRKRGDSGAGGGSGGGCGSDGRPKRLRPLVPYRLIAVVVPAPVQMLRAGLGSQSEERLRRRGSVLAVGEVIPAKLNYSPGEPFESDPGYNDSEVPEIPIFPT
jgi:hypothetical protein